MRVTNGMLVNTTLTGLYNNMNTMNKTYAQMVTGKKIQTVSDDPIIAGRALKLKTSVLENEQYESNAKEATSWMEITEGALTNMHDILQTIRTKCVEAATGTLEKEDKEIIKDEIEELWKQLQEEANVSYGGRYVFTGYKTGQSLMLTTTTFLKEDCKLAIDYLVKATQDRGSKSQETTLKEGSTLVEGSSLAPGTILKSGEMLVKGLKISKEDAKELLGIDVEGDFVNGKYQLSDSYTIKSGTEMTESTVDALARSVARGLGWSEKEFIKEYIGKDARGNYYMKMELDVAGGTKVETQVAEQLLGVEVSADSYQFAVDFTLPADLEEGIYTLKNSITLNQDIVLQRDMDIAEGTNLLKDSVMVSGTKLPAGTVNPMVNGKIDDQSIQYEIGNNSTISVNTLGMDKIFVNMSESIREIVAQVEDSLEADNISTADLHKLFEGKLDEFDKLLSYISKANTDLGARMSRVDYVASRLVDQKTTLKSLLSDTEDIDIEEVYVNFNTQYATYQSALQATSKIITNTLADYL